MKVCHFTEFEGLLEGGITTSIRHQRKALRRNGIEYTENPSEGFDILHLNVPGPESFLQFVKAKRQGKPVVMHSHVTGEDFRNSFRFSNALSPFVGVYTSFLYNRADVVVAPSTYNRKVLRGNGVKTPVEVVSNGVDAERLEGCRQGDGGNGFTVLNLGLRIERKGLSDFVETGRRMEDARFVWYGPELNSFLRKGGVGAEIRNSPSNVEFPGFIDDVNDAFREADVFFFPTREENQGIALLEAAYCGLPLVVRDIPVFDFLEDGENCLKAGTVEGFVEQLERIKKDRELRERIGGGAREVAENHTLDRVGEKLGNVYEKAVRIHG